MGYLVEDWIRDDIPKKIIQQKYNFADVAVKFNNHCKGLSAAYTYGESKTVFERTYFSNPNQPNLRVPGRSTTFQELVYTGAAASPTIANTIGLHRIAPSVNAYKNVTTADFFPRLCPVMRNAREYVESAFPDGAIFLVNPEIQKSSGIDLTGYNVPTQLSKADFIASIPEDDEVVDHYEIYTDKTDGTEQTLLCSYSLSSGTVLYDAFIPVPYSDYAGGNNVYILGYLQSALPEYNSGHGLAYATAGAFRAALIRNAADIKSGLHSGSVVSRLNSALVLDKSVASVIRVCSNTYGQYQPQVDFNGATFYGTVISGNKKQWTQFFDSSGFDWSFDKDIVISPKGDGIRKPTTPGQPDNPYDDTPGDGDNLSDEVEYPEITFAPTSAVYSRYWLNSSEVNDLKAFLFSETFLNDVRRLWTNPAEYVVGLEYYPFSPAALGLSNIADTRVNIGNILSAVSAKGMNDVIPFIYGGSVDITPYFNSYMDYSPYTSIDIFIPYIGFRQLNVNQIMGHRLDIAYVLDLNTRQFTALLAIDGDFALTSDESGHVGTLGKVLTQFSGTMSTQFPLSGVAANEMALNVIQQTAGIISTAGTIAVGIETMNPAAIVSGVGGLVNTVAKNSNLATPNVYGSVSPMSGIFAPQRAYVVINHPIPARPAAWQSLQGNAAGYSGIVSDFTGFLQCSSVDLKATGTMSEAEQKEIISIMNGGFYI